MAKDGEKVDQVGGDWRAFSIRLRGRWPNDIEKLLEAVEKEQGFAPSISDLFQMGLLLLWKKFIDKAGEGEPLTDPYGVPLPGKKKEGK